MHYYLGSCKNLDAQVAAHLVRLLPQYRLGYPWMHVSEVFHNQWKEEESQQQTKGQCMLITSAVFIDEQFRTKVERLINRHRF